MERLLSLARARGATLPTSSSSTSSCSEEGIIRTASAGVTCGLGVRVVSGERTGYAYTDDPSFAAMARAAETAAHIASDSRTLPPEPVSPAAVDRRYGVTSLGQSSSRSASGSWSARTGPPVVTTRASRLAACQEVLVEVLGMPESFPRDILDASVAGGPKGRTATAATDAWMKAETLSYARSRGIFAGVSIEGIVINRDVDTNEAVYGEPVSARKVLGDRYDVPAAARGFIDALNEYSRVRQPSR